jgi:hypothetical protein
MKHISDLRLGSGGLLRLAVAMTDGDQQQEDNRKAPSCKEVGKNKTVSRGFKDGQKRPAENQQNKARDKGVKFWLAK